MHFHVDSLTTSGVQASRFRRPKLVCMCRRGEERGAIGMELLKEVTVQEHETILVYDRAIWLLVVPLCKEHIMVVSFSCNKTTVTIQHAL